jgi:PTS system N-acetylglucosamine-specific IIC component
VLTGVAMWLMDALGVRLGFSFSAGVFDFVLNLDRATRPWLLLPVGLAYFALYYGLFRYFILRFDLRTPGRDEEDAAPAAAAAGPDTVAGGFIAALGGRANLASVDACTTRLRLELVDRGRIDERALKALGARGCIAVGSQGLQVVLGPIADQVAGDIRHALAAPETGAAVPELPSREALHAAFGGSDNIAAVEARSGRVLVTPRDAARVRNELLQSLPLAGAAQLPSGSVHLLHDAPEQVAARCAP